MFQKKNYFKRSQDLKKSYHDAGQFYWGKYDAWLNKKIYLINILIFTICQN